MAKIEDLTFEVKANLTVSRQTAEACLKLVQLYMNQTGILVMGKREEDGTTTLFFEREE